MAPDGMALNFMEIGQLGSNLSGEHVKIYTCM